MKSNLVLFALFSFTSLNVYSQQLFSLSESQLNGLFPINHTKKYKVDKEIELINQKIIDGKVVTTKTSKIIQEERERVYQRGRDSLLCTRPIFELNNQTGKRILRFSPVVIMTPYADIKSRDMIALYLGPDSKHPFFSNDIITRYDIDEERFYKQNQTLNGLICIRRSINFHSASKNDFEELSSHFYSYINFSTDDKNFILNSILDSKNFIGFKTSLEWDNVPGLTGFKAYRYSIESANSFDSIWTGKYSIQYDSVQDKYYTISDNQLKEELFNSFIKTVANLTRKNVQPNFTFDRNYLDELSRQLADERNKNLTLMTENKYLAMTLSSLSKQNKELLRREMLYKNGNSYSYSHGGSYQAGSRVMYDGLRNYMYYNGLTQNERFRLNFYKPNYTGDSFIDGMQNMMYYQSTTPSERFWGSILESL